MSSGFHLIFYPPVPSERLFDFNVPTDRIVPLASSCEMLMTPSHPPFRQTPAPGEEAQHGAESERGAGGSRETSAMH